jgi:hypothetical protein
MAAAPCVLVKNIAFLYFKITSNKINKSYKDEFFTTIHNCLQYYLCKLLIKFRAIPHECKLYSNLTKDLAITYTALS